jgi:YHS domain-containing protein
MNQPSILFVAALTLLALPAFAVQDAKPKPAPHPVPAEKAPSAASDGTIIQKQRPSYPLTSCVACAKPLPEKPFEYVRDGRLFRLDAEDCKKTVDAEPAAMLKKIDAAVVSQQRPTYPLKTSPVSDKPLDANAIDHVYGTRLVRLASQDEVALFEKDSASAMKKLDQAYIDAQLPSYPMKTCPVSTEELGAEPVNYLYGTKLVRFCCKECRGKFEKDPQKFVLALSK